MISSVASRAPFPFPLSAYPAVPSAEGLLHLLRTRIEVEAFNAVATAIFVLVILPAFAAARFTKLAHAVQRAEDRDARAAGPAPVPSVVAGLLHFLVQVEVVFR